MAGFGLFISMTLLLIFIRLPGSSRQISDRSAVGTTPGVQAEAQSIAANIGYLSNLAVNYCNNLAPFGCTDGQTITYTQMGLGAGSTNPMVISGGSGGGTYGILFHKNVYGNTDYVGVTWGNSSGLQVSGMCPTIMAALLEQSGASSLVGTWGANNVYGVSSPAPGVTPTVYPFAATTNNSFNLGCPVMLAATTPPPPTPEN